MAFQRIHTRQISGGQGLTMRVNSGGESGSPVLVFTFGDDLVTALGWQPKQRVGIWAGSHKDRGMVILRVIADKDGVLLRAATCGRLVVKISAKVCGLATGQERDTLVKAVPQNVSEFGVAQGALSKSKELVLCRPKWWGGAGEPTHV